MAVWPHARKLNKYLEVENDIQILSDVIRYPIRRVVDQSNLPFRIS